MRLLLLRTVLCAIAVFALPVVASAQDSGAAAAADADADDEDAAAQAEWLKQLDEAKARLDLARTNILALEGMKSQGAARRYPRGDAKAKYLEELQVSRQEYVSARRALPEVIEGARRAGVPPGVLDPYETAAQEASPVANIDDAVYADPDADDQVRAAEDAADGVYAADPDEAEEATPDHTYKAEPDAQDHSDDDEDGDDDE